MRVIVTNAQRRYPVSKKRIEHLGQCAITRLKIGERGTFSVVFLSPQQMRIMNRRSLRHDHVTDVISFRYKNEPIIGEIFVAPAVAAAYARKHRLSYDEELARYVVHGLLHWIGHTDDTKQRQLRMRTLEDKVLRKCMNEYSL